jgi:hypothetical protein
LYRKIENMLMESGFLMPLFHDVDYRVASPKIRKLILSSSPPYVNYAEVGKVESTVSATARKKGGGGVIHVPIPDEVMSLSPSTAITNNEVQVINCIFERLARDAEGARVVPWLASEFRAEQGGRRYRFRLREDIRFMMGAVSLPGMYGFVGASFCKMQRVKPDGFWPPSAGQRRFWTVAARSWKDSRSCLLRNFQ